MPGSAERLPDDRHAGSRPAEQGRLALLPDDAAECFRAAFEDAAVGMSITGLDRRFIYVNRALARMVGRTQEELRGLPYDAITHPDDLDANVTLTDRATAGDGDTYRMVKRYLRPDGASVWADLSATVIRIGDGSPRYLVAHMLDQTERREQEEALTHRDRILAAVNEAAALLVERPVGEALEEVLRVYGEAAGVSRSYLFEHFDRDGERLTRERAEWNAPGVTPQSGNPRYRGYRLADVGLARWDEVFETGGVISAHVRDLPAVEREVFGPQDVLSVLCVPVTLDGVVTGFLGFDACDEERTFLPAEIDALEVAARVLAVAIRRERADAALAESRRRYVQAQRLESIGRIASGVAHDFNNLLTVIGSYGDLLAESASSDDREIVDEIRAAVSRATTLSRQLLAASRPREDGAGLIDLNTAIREMEWWIARTVGPDVRVETDLSSTPVRVEAGAGDVQQLLLNLSVAAREGLGDGGEVRIATGLRELDRAAGRTSGVLPGLYGVVSVSRVGHADAGLPLAVEPLSSPTLPAHGAGLGLSIASAIAAGAGGLLELAAAPGGGATMTVLLRAAPGADAG